MPKKKRGIDQRVKGNVKAASSSRMTELLNLGSEGVGFVGFEAVSREGKLGGADRIADDTSLLGVSSSSFQVVMKQLGKRDTTTKLKALAEFSRLCEIESFETVMSIMNIWPLMYNKLSMDNDHRVREASHRSLQACAEKIKKGLGPHLRTLIGCWVAGMCDPHGPSSCAALAAFESAFPAEKQSDVFKFGVKAIVLHVKEMVLVENVDTFSDPKVVPEDERVQRYERAVTMAILGLCHMVRKLYYATVVEREGKESDEWQSFLTEARLWKLAKHQNPSVRSAVFSLVVALCHHAPWFVTAHPKLLCPLVLSSLGEGEPVVVGPLWEAVLLIFSTVDSWHTHVNVQKALLPGLWSLMATGGHGCALTVYPCLLPLVSKLKEVVFQDDTFDKNFLQRMMTGLDSDRPKTSPSECEMIMTTFSECLLYFLSHCKTEAGSVSSFYSDLLSLIVQLVDRSVLCTSMTQSFAVAMGVVNMLTHVESLCKKIVPLLSSLDSLWKTIERQLMMHLESDNDKVIVRVGTFLRCFCVETEASFQSAERKSVKFLLQSSEEQMELSTAKQFSTSVTDSNTIVRCAKYIKLVVTSGSALCLNRIYQSSSFPHILLLKLVLQYFADRAFVFMLSQHIEQEDLELNSVLCHTYDNCDCGKEELMEDESKKCIAVVHLLASLTEPSSMQSNCIQLTDMLLDCILSLLRCGILHERLVIQILLALMQRNRDWLSLVSLKLLSCGWLEELKTVLCTCQDLLLQAVFDQHLCRDTRPWQLLEAFITSTTSITILKEMEVAVLVVNRMCSLVEEMLMVEEEQWKEKKHFLQLLSQLDPFFVTKTQNSLEILVLSLLKWSMCSEAYLSESLNLVVECYSHLLTLLPNSSGHLAIAVSHLNDITTSPPLTLDRLLKVSVVFCCLHSNLSLLSIIDHFSDLLSSAVTNATENNIIVPVSSFIQFCEGSLLYSPSCDHVLSTLHNTIPHLLYPVLTFVTLCCDQHLLVDCVSALPSSEKLFFLADKHLPQRTSEIRISLKDDNNWKMWQNVIIGCIVAVETTSSSSLKQTSAMETLVASLCQSIMDHCLAKENFLKMLLSSLLERLLTTDGMLWALLVRRILKLVCDQVSWLDPSKVKSENDVQYIKDEVDPIIIRQLFGCIFSDVTNGSYLQVMLSVCIDANCDWQSNILITTARQSLITNPGIIIGCLSLLPSSLELLSLAGSALSWYAVQQSESHLSLFDNFTVSCKDPNCFSVIYLMVQLVEAQMVPEDCWDMILCTSVSLIQILDDVHTRHSHLLSSFDLVWLDKQAFAAAIEERGAPLSTCIGFVDGTVRPTARPIRHQRMLFNGHKRVHCIKFQLLADITEELSMASCILLCAGLKLCLALHEELSQTPVSSSISLSQRRTEWPEFFLPSIEACLLPMFMSLNDKMSCWLERCFYCYHLLSHHLCKTVAIISRPVSSHLGTLFELITTSQLFSVQITAYNLVSRILVSTSMVIEGAGIALEDHEISVKTIQLLFAKSLEQVNLDVVFLEEKYHEDKATTHYYNTVAYMLVWKLLTEVMAICQAETRVILSEWLKHQSLMEHLLHGLFKYLLEWSSSSPIVTTELSVSLVPHLENLAFLIYLSVAKQFPQMLRQWYLSLDKQMSALVMNFTSTNVSPQLWMEEVERIQSSNSKSGNMEVKVYCGGAQEVAVTYRVDEFNIELAVCVPGSYPLQVPSIKEGRRARVDINQWKKWLLQLSVFVANQNGSILDGLMLWKSNLDKHFAGFEDCMICFSVIHSSNYSVPKMTCRTCKKKFHSACLYKWFSTSAKSSCPLCRNIF